MPKISPEALATYVATARRQQQQHCADLAQLRSQALSVAQTAAQILYHEFEVERVVLFGSVLNPDAFHPISDIDLAVWGLAPNRYIKAVARLMLLSTFCIDVVEAETACPYLQDAIAQGTPL